MPGRGCLEERVYILDVLRADGAEPFVERFGTFFDTHGDAVFPRGSAAEDAGKFRAGFGREFEAELKGLKTKVRDRRSVSIAQRLVTVPDSLPSVI